LNFGESNPLLEWCSWISSSFWLWFGFKVYLDPHGDHLHLNYFEFVVICEVLFELNRSSRCDFDLKTFLCMYSHLDGPIWLPWVLWVSIWFSKPFYKCTLPFGRSNLIVLLGCVKVILILKTFLQVSYTSTWASNLTSLGYVGMILIFKGLWKVCSPIWRFILTFF
jgi:hypothetical protein